MKTECYRCRMSFEVGPPEPGRGTTCRCPECKKRFWEMSQGGPRNGSLYPRVGIWPEDYAGGFYKPAKETTA